MTSDDVPGSIARHLCAAGREVQDVEDRLNRYCGLPWSGGGPETWAFEYFDRVRTGEDPLKIDRVDVLAAGALHSGLSRGDLAFFCDREDDLRRWLAAAPLDVRLHEASADVVQHLLTLASLAGERLPIVSKVLHRKRPGLVPMVDRPLLDRYRPIVGERSATKAWPGLVRAMASDLAEPANAVILEVFRQTIIGKTGAEISRLRTLDISLWMEGR